MRRLLKVTILAILLLTFSAGGYVYANGSNFQQIIYPITECNDGIDNDGDGFIDFAFDPNCTGWGDTSESPDMPISFPVSIPIQSPTQITPSTEVGGVIVFNNLSELVPTGEVSNLIEPNIISQYSFNNLTQILGAISNLPLESELRSELNNTLFSVIGYALAGLLIGTYVIFRFLNLNSKNSL